MYLRLNCLKYIIMSLRNQQFSTRYHMDLYLNLIYHTDINLMNVFITFCIRNCANKYLPANKITR